MPGLESEQMVSHIGTWAFREGNGEPLQALSRENTQLDFPFKSLWLCLGEEQEGGRDAGRAAALTQVTGSRGLGQGGGSGRGWGNSHILDQTHPLSSKV